MPLAQDKSSTSLDANYSDEEIAYLKDRFDFQPAWEKMMAIIKAQGETPNDQVVSKKFFEEFKRLFTNARKSFPRVAGRDTVPPPNSKVMGRKIPVHPNLPWKEYVPDVPDCDCMTAIDAVKEPKPEGGLTFEWYQKWQHKKLNASCIQPCVGQAVEQFTLRLQNYQRREALLESPWIGGRRGRPIPHDFPAENLPGPLSKREETTEPVELEDLKIPVVEGPKKPLPKTYRD